LVTTRFAPKPDRITKPSAKATKATKLKVKKRKTPPSRADKVAVVAAAPSVSKGRGRTMGPARSERAKEKPVSVARSDMQAKKKAKPQMKAKQKATPSAPAERKTDKDLGRKPEDKVGKKDAPAPPVPAPEEHGNGGNGRGKK
jgi:hypothetical protein